MESDRLILGTRKGVIVLQHDGRRWDIQHEGFAGVPISYAMHDRRSEHIWVCADHGHWGQKLYQSHDGGATFEEQETPKYPDGSTMFDVFAGPNVEKPAAVSYLWQIVPGGNDQPGRLYIGTEPGGVFQSDDGGRSFQFVDSFWNHPSRPKNWFGGGRDQAGACSILVDPRDSQHLYIGVSIGGVYESLDGGATWVGRNNGLVAEYLPDPHSEFGHDPHYMTFSRSNPDVLWQQNHCGVFRSKDRGQSWQDISSLDQGIKFGFPIATDFWDDQTAWVIPAISDDKRMAVNGAMFVARTENGGQTWTELRAGLPQQNCYDVVFRHALDISGETLVFGTTTGNLFISHNRGDYWECLANYLPPIYSVRFA